MVEAGQSLLVVPINNTTMEPEMNRLCGWTAPFMVAKVPRPPRTLLVEDLPDYGRSTLETVDPYLDKNPKLVVYGCTAAGFLGGPSGNAEMVEKLERKVGAPVVSTAGAMVEIMKRTGIDRMAVVTPYLKQVNRALESYFGESGVEVETLSSFECATTEALGRITEEQVMEKALATVTPSSPALFIACSQLPTIGILDELRRRLGIPVWSSIAATAKCAELVATGELEAKRL